MRHTQKNGIQPLEETILARIYRKYLPHPYRITLANERVKCLSGTTELKHLITNSTVKDRKANDYILPC